MEEVRNYFNLDNMLRDYLMLTSHLEIWTNKFPDYQYNINLTIGPQAGPHTLKIICNKKLLR